MEKNQKSVNENQNSSSESAESPRPALEKGLAVKMFPYFVVACGAVILTVGLTVDMTMFALRRNYGMDVGQVRGGWFAAFAVADFLLATLYWALLAFMAKDSAVYETRSASDNLPAKG